MTMKKECPYCNGIALETGHGRFGNEFTCSSCDKEFSEKTEKIVLEEKNYENLSSKSLVDELDKAFSEILEEKIKYSHGDWLSTSYGNDEWKNGFTDKKALRNLHERLKRIEKKLEMIE